MIKTTVGDVITAYAALRRLNQEIRLGQDPAWKVQAILRHMKPTVTDHEEVQLKLYRDAGGVERGNGIQIVLDERGEDESAADYNARVKDFSARSNALNDELRAMLKREVEIERDPLTRSIFDNPPNTPEDRKLRFNPNDLADLGPFLTD